ncbi:MAG: hypothetical protein ACJAYC_001990 [Halieaceae bacterium]|jgi:hypothetical protein
MDYDKLKKPAQVKEDIWRQHLNWMAVVGNQADENFRKREKLTNKANAET